MIVWVLIAILLAMIISCEVYTLKTGVPTVTSIPSARKKMIELLAREADQRSAGQGIAPFTIMDLGSGTGKLALEIGRAFPHARITGIEISMVPYLLSQLRKVLWRVPNVHFKRADFWPMEIGDIDAIVVFMNSVIRQRMSAKLKAELKVGALVLSNETHLLDQWGAPLETHEVGLLKLKIVVYRQS